MPGKRIAAIGRDCVACGCCMKVCPVQAITVYKGLKAVVAENACRGCGRCAVACPADIIAVGEREVADYEQALV